MTAILAIQTPEGVLMAGDTRVTDSDGLFMVGESKLYWRGDFLIGVAGSARATQIAIDHAPWEECATRHVYKFLRTTIADRIHEETAKRGCEGETLMLLIAYKGQLFWMDEQCCMMQSNDPWMAGGSGTGQCLGALHATQGLRAEERARLALEAATASDTSVGGPFTLEWSLSDQKKPEGRWPGRLFTSTG